MSIRDRRLRSRWTGRVGSKSLSQEPNNRIERVRYGFLSSRDLSILLQCLVAMPLLLISSSNAMAEAYKANSFSSSAMSSTKEEMRRRLQPELSSDPEA